MTPSNKTSKETAMERDRSYVPPEIIEIILPKLSGKSLLRFKAVSKPWNSMISDPFFVKNHRHISKYSNLFICEQRSFPQFSLVKFENGKFQTVRKSLISPRYNKLLCFCNGVLLLIYFSDTTIQFHSSNNQIQLWNPSTGTTTLFTSPYGLESVLCYGLCHDLDVGGFKAVLIFSSYYLVFSEKYKACTRRKEFEDHTGRVMCGSDVTKSSGVSVDGVVYWVIRDAIGADIIYFDPTDDKFKILQKPENVVDDENKKFYLVNLRGCLCLYCNGEDEKKVVIWTKGKGRDSNSWKKLITIENVGTPIDQFEPQCFVDDKVLILLHVPEHLRRHMDSRTTLMVVYCPFQKTLKRVEEDEDLDSSELVPYVDSAPARKTRPKRKRFTNAVSRK